MNSKTRTAAEVRAWLESHGVTQREVAERIGCRYTTVRNLLRQGGRSKNKGVRGDAYRAAVALGLRPAPAGPSPLDTLPPPNPVTPGEPHE